MRRTLRTSDQNTPKLSQKKISPLLLPRGIWQQLGDETDFQETNPTRGAYGYRRIGSQLATSWTSKEKSYWRTELSQHKSELDLTRAKSEGKKHRNQIFAIRRTKHDFQLNSEVDY
jgi:hypothetical protein